jgi:glycine cleavage system transcriptional repressor
MLHLAITAVGQDRPGIIAQCTGVLFRYGCNLEETSMTRLRDQFAMMLLVRLPDDENLDTLARALAAEADALGLSLVVRPIDVRAAQLGPPGPGYIFRVYGADRPGIVHAVTRLLAERGLNVTDLDTRVIPGSGGPVYVMLLEVDIPTPAEAEALRPELDRLRRELAVEITFGPLEQETL